MEVAVRSPNLRESEGISKRTEAAAGNKIRNNFLLQTRLVISPVGTKGEPQ